MFRLTLSFLMLVLARGQGNNREFTNGDFTVAVKIDAKQPRYDYWAEVNPANKYKVRFSKIYEKLNGSKVGGSNVALASVNWVIGGEETTTETIEVVDDTGNTTEVAQNVLSFWINGTTTKGDFELLAFKNYLRPSSIKFDVLLEGYQWTDAEADSLDLEWKMSNSTDNSPDDAEDEEDETEEPEARRLQEVDESQVCFAGAGGSGDEVCWLVKDTAEAIRGNETSVVPVTLDLDGGFIVVSYANFGEATLLHDPEFGVKSGGGGGCACGSLLAMF